MISCASGSSVLSFCLKTPEDVLDENIIYSDCAQHFVWGMQVPAKRTPGRSWIPHVPFARELELIRN